MECDIGSQRGRNMNTILTVLEDWNTQVQLPGTISQSEATDILQVYAPNINDTDGDAWWAALAVYLGTELGIISPSTYVGLRNYVNNNQTEADTLFEGLQIGLEDITESASIITDIMLEDNTNAQAGIAANITTIEGDKTGGTNQQLDDAYDVAIAALQEEDERLKRILGL